MKPLYQESSFVVPSIEFNKFCIVTGYGAIVKTFVMLGCVYTDAVSNGNGFMTWKPHRKRHGFEGFTRNLSNPAISFSGLCASSLDLGTSKESRSSFLHFVFSHGCGCEKDGTFDVLMDRR